MDLARPLKSWSITVAFLAATGACAQWNFRLDTTFNTNILQRYVYSMALLPTGDLLLSGNMRYSDDVSDRLISLVDEQGDRVLSFPYGYGGGKLTRWQDRSYVGGGQTVRRLLPTGTVDPTFIHMNSHPYFNSLQGGDYHVFPDGRVLMSGSHTLQDSIRGFVGYYELIWFSNEGYLDTTRTHRQSDGTVWAFKELPNGQFVCSGYGTMLEGLPVDRIFRIHADGSPDTTFHTGVFWGEAKSFLTLPDGRFYACGFFRTTQLPGDTLHVARFLPDGTLDTTFTPPDIRDSGLNSIYGALGWTLFAIDPAHLLIGGTFVSVDGQPRSGICLVDTTGQLMPAFHAQGVGPVQDGQGIYTTVQCILPNADTSAIYISGAFVGYNDGIINDAQQRFVSRLLVEEVHVGVQEELAAPQPGPSMRLHPNPAGGTVTLALDQFIPDGELLVRDALGRTVHRQRIRELHTLVHLASLRTGVYVVELLSGGVPHGAQRLVVQR